MKVNKALNNPDLELPFKPKQNTMDDWLTSLMDLVFAKIPDHHLLPKFRADVEKSITAKLQEAPQPTEYLCFDCGNKLFLWDGKYRCIYDGKTQELASLKGGDV